MRGVQIFAALVLSLGACHSMAQTMAVPTPIGDMWSETLKCQWPGGVAPAPNSNYARACGDAKDVRYPVDSDQGSFSPPYPNAWQAGYGSASSNYMIVGNGSWHYKVIENWPTRQVPQKDASGVPLKDSNGNFILVNQTMEVQSCLSPSCIYEDAGNRVVQIATVVPEGQNETIVGTNGTSIWYRVSIDGGNTFLPGVGAGYDGWRPIAEAGKQNSVNRLPGVIEGTNGIWPSSANLIKTSNGNILVPVSYWPLDSGMQPTQPTYHDTFSVNAVLTGVWNANRDDLTWTLGQRVFLPESKSTRGAIEPAIIELKSRAPGTLMMISRGSNAGEPTMKGLRWVSYSYNYGYQWTDPIPFCYGDGTCFYSPSSASNLVYGPNGRLYWIGNINDTNPVGNSKRYPLVIGEVDELSPVLIRGSVYKIDDISPKDTSEVQMSEVSVYNDTKSLVLTMNRLDNIGGQSKTRASWFRIGFAYGH